MNNVKSLVNKFGKFINFITIFHSTNNFDLSKAFPRLLTFFQIDV